MDTNFKTADISRLSAWFSGPRMARYAAAPDPAALYVWDERLSKAYLEDVSHVEVLLRNFVSERLAADCERATGDRRWFDHPVRYNLRAEFARSLERAESRLAREGKEATYDRVVAALSFDVWRFLLVSRLEPTVWRALRSEANGGMPNYPGCRRAGFESRVVTIYNLRNRCSHQEHLVLDDIGEESRRLDECSGAIRWIASAIDPEAAEWILANSRVAEIRASRPA
ncbi:Abi family protein [uncultured Parolsenella sp.]|uniref:Abi family protein n=1 Tax=uncultured Parolsenella sp. TaxID=2083008 RepID=UPI0027D975BA|nr:Abi family protein [uncultured Parolsenella sp.]